MTAKLFAQAMAKFLLGIVMAGALLLGPAGSFAYKNAWLLMAILLVPMFGAGLDMMVKNPDFLKKRLNAKEKRREQSVAVKLSGLMFIAGFVVSGLGYRFGWHMLPFGASLAGAAAFLTVYLLYAEVLRENTYLGRTIEVHQGQKVIDSGLYGVLWHPMYSATLLLFLSMPVVLGSPWALLIFLAYPLIVAKRIEDEEKPMKEELAGYREYKQRVKYRLIPFIW